jgi:hypothetical protein
MFYFNKIYSNWSFQLELAVEFLDPNEIGEQSNELREYFYELMATKLLVGKPKATQWRFFRACFEQLLGSTIEADFVSIPKTRAAQLKFEVENKLRWYFLQPGRLLKYAPILVHQSKLGPYGLSSGGSYPALAGYCLLIRRINGGASSAHSEEPAMLKHYLERIVTECIDAEFRAYAALPEVNTDDLKTWFCPDSPAIKEITTLLGRHRQRGWVINNPLNPSTKRLLRIKVHRVGRDECQVHTTEYWYLRWWDNNQRTWTYPYRETNSQIYILRMNEGSWKVYENLRPSPRTSAPFRKHVFGQARKGLPI